MLSKLADKLQKLAFKKYASVTFQFGKEHEDKIAPELDKHKSDKHKEVEKKLKDMSDEYRKAWESFHYIGPKDQKYEAFAKAHPDLTGFERRQQNDDLGYELYQHEGSDEFYKKKHEINPEMNVANDNARALLESLGYNARELMGKLDVVDLRRKILRFKNSAQEKAKARTRPAENDGGPGTGQVRIISPGLPLSQIENYVDRLEDMAIKATKYGIKEIYYS